MVCKSKTEQIKKATDFSELIERWFLENALALDYSMLNGVQNKARRSFCPRFYF